MGCCASGKPDVDYEFEQIINQVLTDFPLSSCNSKFCRQQLKTAEVEVRNQRKTASKKNSTNKQDINFEYSEEKYYIVIEFLFNMIHPDKKLKDSIIRTTLDITKNSTKILGNKFESNTRSLQIKPDESYIDDRNKEQFEDKVNQSYQVSNSIQSPLNRLYFSIAPSFNDLFDRILKDKPESSFLLFVIGFTKEEPRKKADMLLTIAECGGIKFNIFNFEKMIRNYIEYHLSISRSLLDCISNHKELIPLIAENFRVRLDDFSMKEWQEYNASIEPKKSILAEKFTFIITKELLSIIRSNASSDKLEQYINNHKGNLDHLPHIDVCEMIIKHKQDIIDVDSLVVLLMIHPYLFKAAELRKQLINFIALNDFK